MTEPIGSHAGTPVEGRDRGGEPDDRETLELRLRVTDPETVAELEAHGDGPGRDRFALAALRIGILALKQARGRVDADTVRAEGERLLDGFARVLDERQTAMTARLASSLQEYFDPDSGRLNERIARLVRKDGELEQLLRRQVGVESSELTKTLSAHVGEDSPLMKVLSPDRSKGLLASLAGTLEQELEGQRERILAEFSLDNRDGSLSRLVTELTERHGKLGEDLQGSIRNVVAEFSLDNENSGLSRLVRRVEQAQARISSEFSLDDESSALARMKRELLDILDTHRRASGEFQNEVLAALREMRARKEESLRSTRHGEDFELDVFRFVQSETQKTGDVATHTGPMTGRIRHCRVGDAVVELGPESAAPEARIVVEAKEKSGFQLTHARDELDTAKKNRDAQVGLFVFSSRSAPDGLEPFARYGNDLVVVWDAENPSSDVYLAAGISVARALCARRMLRREAQEADFESIERAIRSVEKQAAGLGDITRLTETIRSNSGKILERARIVQESLLREVGVLDERIGDLKTGPETPD